MKLIDIIPVGRSCALTARQLADLLETTPREVTRSIEAARRRGVPICASVDGDNGGYYIPENAKELSTYLARREHRTRNIQNGTAAMRETLMEMQGKEKTPSAEQSPNNQH
jgi:predicted DNA-binding transcriptional regulator YafY